MHRSASHAPLPRIDNMMALTPQRAFNDLEVRDVAEEVRGARCIGIDWALLACTIHAVRVAVNTVGRMAIRAVGRNGV